MDGAVDGQDAQLVAWANHVGVHFEAGVRPLDRLWAQAILLRNAQDGVARLDCVVLDFFLRLFADDGEGDGGALQRFAIRNENRGGTAGQDAGPPKPPPMLLDVSMALLGNNRGEKSHWEC